MHSSFLPKDDSLTLQSISIYEIRNFNNYVPRYRDLSFCSYYLIYIVYVSMLEMH